MGRFRSVNNLLLALLLFCITTSQAQQNRSSKIDLGSSLSLINPSTSWASSSGHFAFGFYKEDNGFMVGIWLVDSSNKTVVWTANRDGPPITASINSTLELTKNGLVLTTDHQQGGGGEKLTIIIPNPTGGMGSSSSVTAFALMLDNGNFVLCDNDNKVAWQSFDYPTDTIVGGQKLTSGMKLVSSLSETNHSIGRYELRLQTDGNLVLYPLNSEETPIDAYWASDTWRLVPNFLYLNYTGLLTIINTTDSNILKTFPDQYSPSLAYNETTIFRATLDFDGVFRLYSHTFKKSSTINEPKVSVEWKAPENPCEVNGFCGLNSFCTLDDYRPYCRCLPGTDFIDPNQWSLGCNRNFSQPVCRGGGGGMENKQPSFNITTMENMQWKDVRYAEESISSIEDCKKSCLEDCNCGAALYVYGESYCRKYSLPLKYARRDVSASALSTALFKVGSRSNKSGNGTVDHPDLAFAKPPPTVLVSKSKKAVMLILMITIGLLTSSCAALAISGLYVYKFRVLRYERLLECGNLGITDELTLQLYTYNELRKATNGFKEELGKGSFGAVYKGTLYKGKKLIAVKRLEKVVEEGEREFLAEVRAIGRTHHRNLVRLLGYCIEDSKRLLVYEYMSNGSLADLLFKKPTRYLDWNERKRISLNVARGILYLHEECDAPIIHCDIKPQNILMDEFWTAKISDFGLAKLLMPDQTRTFTGVRGTRGYMAPEWQRNTPISVKTDVYSYGIVLLEIVCCRRNLEVHVSKPEEVVLSNWVYMCFAGRELHKLVGTEEVDEKTLENMVKVGLWCIQDEPALRPSMKSVVLMLEGITDVSIPPCPTTPSI